MNITNRIDYLKERLKKMEKECESEDELKLIKETAEYNVLQLKLCIDLFILEIAEQIKEIIKRR